MAAAGCQVSYAVTSQWPGGFGANATVTNLGDPINTDAIHFGTSCWFGGCVGTGPWEAVPEFGLYPGGGIVAAGFR